MAENGGISLEQIKNESIDLVRFIFFFHFYLFIVLVLLRCFVVSDPVLFLGKKSNFYCLLVSRDSISNPSDMVLRSRLVCEMNWSKNGMKM